MILPAGVEAVLPLKDADAEELRARLEAIRDVLRGATESLPENRPVPRRAVQAIALLVESIIDGED